MTYRDESSAALARVDALEDRVRELERENSALRAAAGASRALSRRSALMRLSLALWALATVFLTLGVVLSLMVAPPFDALLPVFGATMLALSLAGAASMAAAMRVVAGPREVLLLSSGRGLDVALPGEGRVAFPLLHGLAVARVEARPVELTLAAPTRDGQRVVVTVKATVGWVMTRESLSRAATSLLGAGDESVDRVMLPSLERAAREVIAGERADEVERYEPELCARVEKLVAEEVDALGLDVRVTALTRGLGAG